MQADSRTTEQIQEHYQLERRLASQLRGAPREERMVLYRSLYDELLQKIPHHPLLQPASVAEAKAAKAHRDELVIYELGNLKPFLRPQQTYMEIGPGDCAVALAVAGMVSKVIAVDVSTEITKRVVMPENFRLAISSGTDIPVPPGSVDVAFSSQLMEHLHPDDALEQLKNIYTALAPGGVYLCITPSRFNGPHDVSRGFDPVPTGFHLQEYSIGDLRKLFLKTGFTPVKAFVRAKKIAWQVPAASLIPLEWSLDRLPYAMRARVASLPVMRNLLGVKLVGVKPLSAS
jgi:SAM-dependent methyltransferase